MHHSVSIYDTTLRDGAQGEGISFSLEDKLKVAQRLDAIGVSYIEGGWPGSNAKDLEFFRRIADVPLKGAQVAAFGATRRAGAACETDAQVALLLDAQTPIVTLVGKSWDLHVHHVLETTLEENLAMIADTVRYLVARGRRVFYDAEHFFDGYKANQEYALACVAAAQEAGAEVVVLCDTNGGTMPWEIEACVAATRTHLAGRTATPAGLGIHTHDDSGLAVANALAAVRAGCTQVQGTINGIGERVGNCDLCTVIPNLQLKLGVRCQRRTTPAVVGAVALRGRGGQPRGRSPAAVRRSERIRAQGRHPRGGRDESGRQLPAHRSCPGGQRTPRPGERALRQGQPRLQGAGVRGGCQQG